MSEGVTRDTNLGWGQIEYMLNFSVCERFDLVGLGGTTERALISHFCTFVPEMNARKSHFSGKGVFTIAKFRESI